MKTEHTELCKAFMRLRKLNISSVMTEISPAEHGLMKAIEFCAANNDGVSTEISQVTKATHISAPAVSKGIKKLEERGFAERNVNRSDRRYTFVSLTESGKEALRTTDMILEGLFERALDRMGVEDAAKLTGYLNAFEAAASAEIEAACTHIE